MRIAITNDNRANRVVLQHIIKQHPQYSIAWTANDGHEAIIKCKKDTPDIILMDMIMPEMNGVDACQAIMENTPCAIIIVTASVTGNAAMIFEAMSYGAIDVVKTPFSDINTNAAETDDLLRKIKIVSRLIETNYNKNKLSTEIETKNNIDKNKNILVIGASTGGPGVLATILHKLPADFPIPVVIIQHVDSSFSNSFASWLNKQSSLDIRIAKEGEYPKAGTVLVAGKSDHLIMTTNGKLSYSEEPKELIYKPSVDVFFNSVVKQWQGTVIAALLTGMGKDGAEGLANIHKMGGHTITQTKDSCAVYGMPKAADDIGAATESLDPEDIANSIINIIYG